MELIKQQKGGCGLSIISIKRASELLGVSRSTLYYNKKEEKESNIELMEAIEQLYLRDPSAGYRRMKVLLERQRKEKINHKRVRRLMRKMGLKGITPAAKTTISGISPYKNLLKREGGKVELLGKW